MKETKRKHDGAFKARVILEVIRGQRTIAEIASEYGVHPNQITAWKKQFLERLPKIFTHNYDKGEKSWQEEREALLKKIGELEIERDWLQKKLNSFSLKKEKGV